MAVPRRTTRLVEQQEGSTDRLRLFVRTVEEVMKDERVECHERRIVAEQAGVVLADQDADCAEAALVDGGFELLGILVRTLEPTPWFGRKARELDEDRRRLIADGVLVEFRPRNGDDDGPAALAA